MRHGPAAFMAALMLVACGGGGAERAVPAAPARDPGFVAADGYEMRYGILLASELPPQVATTYAIERSRGRVIVNVSVLRRNLATAPPLAATVRGSQRSLIGTAAPLEFRAVLEDTSVSYIAAFEVANQDPVIIEIEAVPAGSDTRLHTRVTRSFDR